jgi:hypothetical protein
VLVPYHSKRPKCFFQVTGCQGLPVDRSVVQSSNKDRPPHPSRSSGRLAQSQAIVAFCPVSLRGVAVAFMGRSLSGQTLAVKDYA